MDFLKKFTDSANPQTKAETTDKSAPASEENSSLLSSAKVVADAARSTLQNEPAEKKHDNAEVAGAAADLLDAAQNYGKLDKTSGVGSYVDKAGNYLHEYETSHSTKPKASEQPKPSSEKEEEPVESAKPTSDEPKAEKLEEEPKATPEKEETKEPVTSEEPKPTAEKEEVEEPASESAPARTTTEEPKKEEEPSESAKPTTDSEEKTGGLGDCAKAAGGFLKKEAESAEGEKGESGGIGQYAKLAEGYLSKPSDSEGSKTDGGDLLKMAGGFLGKN